MIPQGYKQTEIGVIPEDWKIASLKDLSNGRFTYGVNAPAIPYAPPLPNYIRITDISDDGRFMRESRTSVDCQNPEMYTLKENDIVFARTGASTGKTYLYRKNDGDLVYAGFLIKASILPEKANSKYVFDNLHTNRYWDWVSVTSMRSGQPGINGNEYASYMIPCPSLPEQEHIAEVLSDVDSMISSLEKLIAKKKGVKQGAMQELLTGKKRLPGFTGEWKECVLGDLCYLITKQTGFDYTNEIKPALVDINSNGTLPFIQNKDFSGKKINTQTDYYIPYDVALKYPRILLDETCLLVSLSGRIGNVGLYEKSNGLSFIGGAVGICRFNKEQNAEWCMLYLQSSSGQKQIFECQKSGAQHNLTVEDVRKLVVKLPSTLEEQTAIASILSDMDNEIEALEQKFEKTRQIKQGMMQQLLTGKIRLV